MPLLCTPFCMNASQRLIHAFQTNHDAGIRPFYQAVKERFLKMYRGKLDRDSLMDVFQEAFVRLYEAALKGKLDEVNGDLDGYLLGICRHLVARKLGQLIQHRTEEWNPDIHVEVLEWEELEEEDVREKKLGSAFEKLGEQCQKILQAFYYLGWDMVRISKEMNYPNAETAKSQKYRCMQHLKKQLK